MPWSPDWEVVDPRLDPYRDQVAELRRAGQSAGHLLVLGRAWSFRVSGHLWWRHWDTRELPMLYVELADGTSFDTPVRDEDVEQELGAWREDRFCLEGEDLEIVWLSQNDALEIAPAVFGVAWCLDNGGQVRWSWPGN